MKNMRIDWVAKPRPLGKPLPQRVADDILFVLKQIDELRRDGTSGISDRKLVERKDEDESA